MSLHIRYSTHLLPKTLYRFESNYLQVIVSCSDAAEVVIHLRRESQPRPRPNRTRLLIGFKAIEGQLYQTHPLGPTPTSTLSTEVVLFTWNEV